MVTKAYVEVTERSPLNEPYYYIFFEATENGTKMGTTWFKHFVRHRACSGFKRSK